MKALCGAASPCRGATTVRQLQTRGEWWEGAVCVEHTERVQLQWHCEGVDENSAALACEGVDENASHGRKLVAIQTVALAHASNELM